jgi:hypothetical protein
VKLPFDVYTITVQRARKVVRNGSVYEDWTNPVEHTIPDCEIQGGDSREDHDRADGVEIAFRVWAPIEADLKSQDRVRFTYAGRNYTGYQVEGEPRVIADPLLGHIRADLVKREG